MRQGSLSFTDPPSQHMGQHQQHGDAHFNRSIDSRRKAVSCCDCRCCCDASPMQQCLQRVSHQIRGTVLWKSLNVFFTFVLLFGSPLQTLAAPKSWDLGFDILYTTTLSFFLLDMLFSFLTDREYFSMCRRTPLDNAVAQSTPSSWRCKFGSFNFWCDVISTATLVADISYVNREGFEIKRLDIELNQFGLPTNFGEQINPPIPIAVDSEILVVIARAARIARSVPSSTVVEVSLWLNLYWYIERLMPGFYIGKIQSWRQRKQKEDEAAKNPPTRRPVDLKESVFAAKAKQLQEANEKQQGFMTASLRSGMRFLGLAPDSNLELKRNMAATKIQKAWRRKQMRHSAIHDIGAHAGEDNESSSWRGRFRRSSALIQRVFGKRSSHPRNSQASEGGLESARNAQNVVETKPESQLGTAMGELTGQRLALGVLFGLILTSLLTYRQANSTPATTMVMLHGQTIANANTDHIQLALGAARNSSATDLFYFKSDRLDDGDTNIELDFKDKKDTDDLRDREKLAITVMSDLGVTTGMFMYRSQREDEALVELLSTIFVLLMWFLGVTAFAGPVMTLVITPIERMVRLLQMLMLDPLGYQSSSRFKKFMIEDEKLTKDSRWTKEVLKGMETSFLMSTILRIGSLMKVGFGSAGVEIIRNNLSAGQSTNTLFLQSEGSTVSCIFLFCDIRQFTDATESLQEEVFVFTNRIAAVVHSNCHAYGGSANKNVGDAFLVSWTLGEDKKAVGHHYGGGGNEHSLCAKHNQADKCMLSVVRICIALRFDDFYLEPLSIPARNALLSKVKKRSGPVVQMGFGLHAGKAVQGAIGSQRKIDATYVSEAVERAEFLESSTKLYGLPMLMSDTFHSLLHSSNRRRCRKIDQIMFENDDEEEEDDFDTGDRMDMYTYDMDIGALSRSNPGLQGDGHDAFGGGGGLNRQQSTRIGPGGGTGRKVRNRRKSMLGFTDMGKSEEMKSGPAASMETGTVTSATTKSTDGVSSAFFIGDSGDNAKGDATRGGRASAQKPELPTGPKPYSAKDWLKDDMSKIRQRYTTVMFQKFNTGLEAFYSKDWDRARQCFESVQTDFRDGPSEYFLGQILKNNGRPPRGFQPYGRA